MQKQIKKMKQFYIQSTHDIHVDDFNMGELEWVHEYNMEAKIKAETSKEAIEKYFEKTLYLSFDFNNAMNDEDNSNVLFYSNLVDVENGEATEKEKELWKKDKMKLYSNTTRLTIYELTEVNTF